MLHRTRDLLICQRTQVINCVAGAYRRARYYGCTRERGAQGELLAIIASASDERLPAPTVPNVIGSDRDFNQAMKSAAVFGGNAFLPRIHSGEASRSEIG
jgi:hypothetical protein